MSRSAATTSAVTVGGSLTWVYALICFQQTIASLTHIVAQEAIHQYDANLILILRSGIASVCLLLILAWQEKSLHVFKDIEQKDFWKLVLLGALNVPINQWLFLQGLRYTTPANSALLYAMTPALVFLFTLGSKEGRPSWKKILGILMAFVGVSIIMFERGATLASDHTHGNILIFLAVIAWSLYTLLGKGLVEKYGALRTTGLNMILGTVLYLPIALTITNTQPIAGFSTAIWLEVLYLGIIASVVNYLLWFFGLKKLETNKLAIFQNLQPVLTTAIAVMLSRAFLTEELAGGGILALVGVILVQLAR